MQFELDHCYRQSLITDISWDNASSTKSLFVCLYKMSSPLLFFRKDIFYDFVKSALFVKCIEPHRNHNTNNLIYLTSSLFLDLECSCVGFIFLFFFSFFLYSEKCLDCGTSFNYFDKKPTILDYVFCYLASFSSPQNKFLFGNALKKYLNKDMSFADS